jgi:uncharacterized protein involved in exopolysaccharide biosynthesis
MFLEQRGGSESSAEQVGPNADILGLMRMVEAVGSEKKRILALAAICAAIGIAASFRTSPTYYATSLILPPHQALGSSVSMPAWLSEPGGVAVRSPDDMSASLIKSNLVLDSMVLQFDLQKHYRVATLQDARDQLAAHMIVAADKKSGLLAVTVSDLNSKFAADLANGVVPALRRLLERNAATEAQQRRQFLDERIVKVRSQIADVQARLQSVQSSMGLPSIDMESDAANVQPADRRSEIAGGRVNVESMSTLAAAEDGALHGVRAHAGASQEKSSGLATHSRVSSANSDVSKQLVSAVRMYRDLRNEESTLDALATQSTVAPIDETLVQQVDAASAPDRPVAPKRLRLAAGGFLFGLILGSLLAILSKVEVPAPYKDSLRRIQESWSVRRRKSLNNE